MGLPLALAIARWRVDGGVGRNQSRRGAPAIRTEMSICDNWRGTAARLIRRLEALRNGAQMAWSSPRLWHRIVANNIESSDGVVPPIVGASSRRNGRTTSTAEVSAEDRYAGSRHGRVAGVRVRLFRMVG